MSINHRPEADQDLLHGFSLLLLDDNPLFRDGLTTALRHQAPGLRVQATGILDEALDVLNDALITGSGIDLVLLDYRLPGIDGLRGAAPIMQRHPMVGVGLMSGLDDPTLPIRAKKAGLMAYLPKSLEVGALLTHLRCLAGGEPVFVQTVYPLMPPKATPEVSGLTPRQWDVLHQLAIGGSNKEIARAIGISPATVKNHLEAIFAKLGATNRLQAVMLARTLLNSKPS